MSFRRLGADAEKFRGLLRAFSVNDQSDHLPFAGGQKVKPGFCTSSAKECVKQRLADLCREVRVVIDQGFDRGNQLLAAVRFHKKTADAGLEEVTNNLLGIMQCED